MINSKCEDILKKKLKSFRYLFNDITSSPESVLKDALSNYPLNKMVFSCDLIDLRDVIKEEKIENEESVVLFSLKFAEKYLKRYPLFLVLDISKIKCLSCGKIKIFRSPLEIDKKLKQIIINKPTDESVYNTVNTILKELDSLVEVIISNSVPGLSSPDNKLMARNEKKMNWYKTSQILIDPNFPKEKEGVVKGPLATDFPFSRGMKVRDRRRGMALPQEYGIVNKISEDEMEVDWYNEKDKKSKTDKFRLDDLTSIISVLAEV